MKYKILNDKLNKNKYQYKILNHMHKIIKVKIHNSIV